MEDVNKLSYEILKANSKRKINWVIFLVGLVIFLISYNYLRTTNAKLIANTISSANPYGVSYTDAYNSKQLDTIRDVPNFRRLAPFTPSTTPVSNAMLLGVVSDVVSDGSNYYSYNGQVPLFKNPNYTSIYRNVTFPNGQFTGNVPPGTRIEYICSPPTIYDDTGDGIDEDKGFYPQLLFQNEADLYGLDPVVVFVPYRYDVNPDHNNFFAGVLVYTDYDIVFDQQPKKPTFLLWQDPPAQTLYLPLVDPDPSGTYLSGATFHGTQWYANPTSEDFFQPAIVDGVPNPNAGRPLLTSNGDQSQIPFAALNTVYVVANGSSTVISSFLASPPTIIPQGPSGLAVPAASGSPYTRSYYLRDPDNLNDGTCISLVGLDVRWKTLHPTSNRNTWIVLNGTWTLLPEFVLFDSVQNENPLVVYITANAAPIPITLANLANRWIVMSTKLTTLPDISEPSFLYLNSSLGIALNAIGRQGVTIMSSSLLSDSVLPYRTILSVKGDTSGKYFWFVMYAAWVAGFVGQAYISEVPTPLPSNHPYYEPAVGTPAIMLPIVAATDMSKTFLYVMLASQSQLLIPSRITKYSFILTVVSAPSSIDVFMDTTDNFVTNLTSSFADSSDPNYNSLYTASSASVTFWPTASVSYFITVFASSDPSSIPSEIVISPPFGLSKSLQKSL